MGPLCLKKYQKTLILAFEANSMRSPLNYTFSQVLAHCAAAGKILHVMKNLFVIVITKE